MKTTTYKNISIALLVSVSLIYYFQASTGNIAGIIFFLGFYYVLSHVAFISGRRAKICAGTASFLCSAALVLGKIGRSNESILDALGRFVEILVKDAVTVNVSLNGYHSIKDGVVLLVTMAGLWFVGYYLFLKLLEIAGSDTFYDAGALENGSVQQSFWGCFLIIMLCWMPYFIVNFPGVLSYDSINQITQIEASAPLNDHHPVIHTVVIGFFYSIGKKIFFSANAGVALYSMAQMAIMALVFSRLIMLLHESGLKNIYSRFVLFYFAALPLHAVYAVTMWKDILFSGFTLWFSISVYEIFVLKRQSRGIWVQFVASGSLMALFRSNGIIIFILCMPFFLYVLRKSVRKAGIIIIPLCIFMIVKGPVYHCFQVEHTDDIVESLSIPIQHIARVVVNDADGLSQEERTLIENIAPLEDIKNTYNCRFADPMKNLIWGYGTSAEIESHKWEYFKLWLVLGIKHPVQYVLAEIDATVGYWYPDEQYTVIFSGVCENDFGIHPILDQQGKMHAVITGWYDLYRSVPVLGNLFSMGTVFLITIFAVVKIIYDGQYQRILIALPSLAGWFTIMIASPMHAEMRYVYSMMLTLPLVIATAFLPHQ